MKHQQESCGFMKQIGNLRLDSEDTTRAQAETVYDWLCRHAHDNPEAPAVAEWRDDTKSPWLSYSAVLRSADELAIGLRQWVRPGDRVMLILPNGISFYCSFLACVAAGVVAVPCPTPGLARGKAFSERLTNIADDCGPALAVTDPMWEEMISELMSGRCRTIAHVTAERQASDQLGGIRDVSSPVALLQYTSGSTGRPRAITITHEAIRANCFQAAQAYGESGDDVGVSWVPLYHDLGLNTGIMRPLFSGYPSVLLRPDDFVRRPLNWLRAIDVCHGTLSSAPNFAYDLCVRKVPHEYVAGLDLRKWRIARNAGEVVRADTVKRFARHFKPAGFSEGTICTGYGLAEATLSVTTCTPQTPPLHVQVLRDDLQTGMVTMSVGHPADQARVQTLLSSGVPLAGTQVRAGDGKGRVGPISIRGPQVVGKNSAQGSSSPQGEGCDHEWYDTGDIGFIYEGHLFVVGRVDDTVVHRGRNFYLSDVIAICDDIDGLRPGRVVLFVSYDQERATDKLCVVTEVRSGITSDTGDLDSIEATIRHRLAFDLELFVNEVAFVPAGAIPVTTSGKLRASEARRLFGEGRLPLLSVH
jgi:acyl-CoA synthetase (AMP-forming)/AMP-acid ligase II